VRADGALLSITAAKQKAVLATLLLRPGEPVSTDALIEALWPDKPPPNALTSLQGYVLSLRRLIEPEKSDGNYRILVTMPPGYALLIAHDQVDLGRFELLHDKGIDQLASGSASAAAEMLREALALWRGPALADFRYESFAQTAIGRLEEARLACIEERIEADLALGRHSELVGELETLLAEHPLREGFVVQLMLALYRGGRQADALKIYQRARRRLVEELGIEPGPELQTLNRQILNQDAALAGPDGSEPSGVSLPAAPTPLVGRRQELAELADLFDDDDVRLITVLGPGGVGKTRLALAAASAAVHRFPGGVSWVALQALRDPRLVGSTIAQALGSTTEPAAAIGDARMLVALDNFEQVVDAAVDVAELVASCPNLTVIVTSREPLRVAAEREYPVTGLSETDAVALFTERANAIRPGLDANGEVVAICERLDRLPLALELAAARVNVLSIAGILDRLDHRLGVLTRSARDVPSRHQTLRQTIGWSYELLDESERRDFARLGVFAGGWTLGAAEAICELDLDALASLIDKSLVRRRAGGSDGEVRYAMLETIREYALERLGELEPDQATCGRYVAYFLDLAERAYPNLRGAESSIWLEQIEEDHDNMRAALAFALDRGDLETALRLAGALARYWLVRGQLSEGRRWLETALAQPGRSKARPRALRGLALLDLEQGELEQPQHLAEEALALALDQGDPLEAAKAAGLLADAAWYRGDLETAEAHYERAVGQARTAGDELEVAINLHNLGEVYRAAAELDKAETCLQESLQIATQLDDAFGQASGLLGLVYVADARGDRELGLALLTKATDLLAEIRNVGGIAECLVAFGKLTAEGDDPARAARAWGAASALGAEIGRDLSNPAVVTAHEDAVAAARSALGNEAFDRHWLEGELLSLDEATACVLDESTRDA
jgi:predicted ATPase/DNA-binding SARP family transcriptional activator